MGKVRMIAALVCIIFLSSIVLIPFANADWTMFRSDPSHNGVGTGNPTLTPTLLWNYTFGTGLEVDSSPAVVNGVVYIGSADGNVYALNATNGAKLWNYTTHGDVSSPAVVNGVVYISSVGNVLALNAINGAKIWNYSTDDQVNSSPAVAGAVVYIGSYDHNVYALNATNGARLWNYTTGDQVASSPAVVNNVVYVGSYDHNVYALNATNGDKLWSYATKKENAEFSEPNSSGVDSSPAVVNGVVYIGSIDGNVYALDASNGHKLWNYSNSGAVDSSPAIANNAVYVGTYNGNVYALDAANGAKLWNYATGGAVVSSPAVVNGVVYIFSEDDNVYALGASPTSSPSNTSSNTLPIIVGSVAAVVIIAAVVFLMFQKRLKTKPTSPQPQPAAQTMYAVSWHAQGLPKIYPSYRKACRVYFVI